MMSGLLFSGCSNPSCMWHGLTIDLAVNGQCAACAGRAESDHPLYVQRVRDLPR